MKQNETNMPAFRLIEGNEKCRIFVTLNLFQGLQDAEINSA